MDMRVRYELLGACEIIWKQLKAGIFSIDPHSTIAIYLPHGMYCPINCARVAKSKAHVNTAAVSISISADADFLKFTLSLD